jgi:predicted 2-oxoglutarate/Fe(II)-dependent dioxygenase YbiX
LSIAKPPAPVLVVPMVFEPDFCRKLIQLYEQDGGEDSGFIRTDPATGKTVTVIDHSRKARRDYSIESAEIREVIRARMEHRLAPEIMKCFHFMPTRIERYIVACYDARDHGHFLAHRDDTTKGAAHRKFAVTINLNAEEYEGGNLRFPEYDSRQYRAPTGGAIVFSCSVLHEATPVTRGKRYAVLPFLYDEESAKIREANLKYIDDEALREQVRRQIARTPSGERLPEVAAGE